VFLLCPVSLFQFELEIQKIHENYESLVKSSKKREQLEVAMKKRLEDELKKVKAINTSLVQQLQNAGQVVSENAILESAEPVDSSMALLLARRKYNSQIFEHCSVIIGTFGSIALVQCL